MMRMTAAIVGALLATASSAAIVTARNNYFVCPPSHAAFYGTHATPGISSQWIPYGTYTDGTGGTEYLRATAKLEGAVYSVFDGLAERSCAVEAHWDNFPSWDYDDNTNKIAFVLPQSLWRGDIPGFLDAPTNQNTRIVDLFNADCLGVCLNNYYGSGWRRTGLLTYPGDGNTLEDRLAKNISAINYGFDGKYAKSGLAAYFGGRYLDAALGDNTLVTPIPTAWTTNLPFVASQSNDWVNVWPTYSAIDCDIRIWPYVNYEEMGDYHDNVFVRQHLREWMTYGAGDWYADAEEGDPYGPQAEELYNALCFIPAGTRIEDILSRDTGLEYRQGDYTQWDVGGVVLSGNGNPYGGDYAKGIDPMGAEWSNGDITLRWDKFSGGWFLLRHDPETGEDEWIGQDSSPWGSTQLSFASGIFQAHDDYRHWKNNSTRLDWKRLGIIAQLERHMEETYHLRGRVGGLQCDHVECKREITYRQTNDWSLVAYWSGGEESGTWLLSCRVDPSLESDEFTMRTNILSSSHNPYCSFGEAHVSSSWTGTGRLPLLIPVSEWDEYLDADYCGIMVSLVASGPNGGFVVEAPGQYWNFIFGPAAYASSSVELKECSYTRTNGKSGDYAHTTTTVSAPTLFPEAKPWADGLVKSVWLPTLECMLSVSNDASFAYGAHWDGLSYPEMLEGRQATNSIGRTFRMVHNSTACHTTNDYIRTAADMLRSLNSAVHAKCSELSGKQLSQFESAANWMPSESDIRQAQAGLTFECGISADPVLQVGFHQVKPTSEFVWADGHVTSSLPVMEDENGVRGYLVGWVRVHGGETGSVRVTNCVPAAVEGKLNTMQKTLWRFNNLCDPNL